MAQTLQSALFVQAVAGVCPVEVKETISGWMQYSVNVDLFLKPERDKIDRVAAPAAASETGGVAELVEIESGVVSGMSTQTIRR